MDQRSNFNLIGQLSTIFKNVCWLYWLVYHYHVVFKMHVFKVNRTKCVWFQLTPLYIFFNWLSFVYVSTVLFWVAAISKQCHLRHCFFMKACTICCVLLKLIHTFKCWHLLIINQQTHYHVCVWMPLWNLKLRGKLRHIEKSNCLIELGKLEQKVLGQGG